MDKLHEAAATYAQASKALKLAKHQKEQFAQEVRKAARTIYLTQEHYKEEGRFEELRQHRAKVEACMEAYTRAESALKYAAKAFARKA